MNHRSPLTWLATSVALLGAIGVAQAGALEPPAGPIAPTMKTLDQVEARRPIHQSDLPLAIIVDGSYYLAENLNANQNGVDMITVFAADVSIDLNGFAINGTSQVAQAADCIQIEPGARTFALSNGVIRSCAGYGLVTNSVTGLTVSVDRVQANQNGQDGIQLGLGSYGVVSRSVFRSNGARGVLLSEGVIQNCTAVSNGTHGIQVIYGVVQGCFTRSNAGINTLVFSGGVLADTYAP